MTDRGEPILRGMAMGIGRGSMMLALAASSVACANLAGLDDFADALAPTTDGTAGSAGASVEPATGGAGGLHDGGAGAGAGGSGGEPPACEIVAFEAFAEADSVIFEGPACDAANYAGGQPYANIGAGRGLFRFALEPAVAAALRTGEVRSLELVLTRDVDCLGDGACPAAAGHLVASPLRNDWEEGPVDFVPYQGADWCRRGAGQGGALWQAPGASGPADADAPSGEADVDSAAASVVIDLDPTAHAAFVDDSAGDWAVSVRVDGEDGAVFVAATKEEFEPAEPPARLSGTHCLR